MANKDVPRVSQGSFFQEQMSSPVRRMAWSWCLPSLPPRVDCQWQKLFSVWSAWWLITKPSCDVKQIKSGRTENNIFLMEGRRCYHIYCKFRDPCPIFKNSLKIFVYAFHEVTRTICFCIFQEIKVKTEGIEAILIKKKAHCALLGHLEVYRWYRVIKKIDLMGNLKSPWWFKSSSHKSVA